MKRFAFLFILSSLALFQARAQSVKDAFVQMPQSVFFTADKSARLDLLDLYEAGREATVKDAFGSDVQLTQLTAEYLTLNAGTSSLQLILLPVDNDSPVICVIKTTCGPICDSRLSFYSAAWEELNTNKYISPVGNEWFFEKNSEFSWGDLSFMQYTYDAETKTLIQRNNTVEYLPLEEQEKATLQIKQREKECKWERGRFR